MLVDVSPDGWPAWLQTGVAVSVLLFVVWSFTTDRWLTARSVERDRARYEATVNAANEVHLARLAHLETEVAAWREAAGVNAEAARIATLATERAVDSGKTTLGILQTLDRVIDQRAGG